VVARRRRKRNAGQRCEWTLTDSLWRYRNKERRTSDQLFWARLYPVTIYSLSFIHSGISFQLTVIADLMFSDMVSVMFAALDDSRRRVSVDVDIIICSVLLEGKGERKGRGGIKNDSSSNLGGA